MWHRFRISARAEIFDIMRFSASILHKPTSAARSLSKCPCSQTDAVEASKRKSHRFVPQYERKVLATPCRDVSQGRIGRAGHPVVRPKHRQCTVPDHIPIRRTSLFCSPSSHLHPQHRVISGQHGHTPVSPPTDQNHHHCHALFSLWTQLVRSAYAAFRGFSP